LDVRDRGSDPLRIRPPRGGLRYTASRVLQNLPRGWVLLAKVLKKIFQIAILISVVIGAIWAVIRVVTGAWALFKDVDPALSAAILTAATTVMVSTFTIVLGRYFERKKDIEAAYRQTKTEIYDTFLQEL